MSFSDYHKRWTRLDELREKIFDRTAGRLTLVGGAVCFKVGGRIVAAKGCSESPVKDIVRLLCYWNDTGGEA